MPQHAVSLDDKYARSSGRIFLTGIQALVRLPMVQRQRDLAAGLDTAGYVSGYRGSPLGSFDQELWKAGRFLEDVSEGRLVAFRKSMAGGERRLVGGYAHGYQRRNPYALPGAPPPRILPLCHGRPINSLRT